MLRPPLCALLLLGLMLAAPTGYAMEGSASPSLFLLPPEGPSTGYLRWGDELARSLGVESRYVLGPAEPNERQVRDEGNGTIALSWAAITPDGIERVELRQRVAPGGPDGNYGIQPRDLQPGVEIWAGASLLRLSAPPGVLPHGEPDLRASAEGIARTLGIPPAEPSAWTVSKLVEAAPIRLFGHLAPHVPGFYLTCECTVLTRHEANLSPNLNLVRIAFDPEGAPVAIELSPWVDLARANLLSMQEASRALRQELEREGDVGTVEFFRTELAFDEMRLLYEWRVTKEGDTLIVSQDAREGGIVSMLGPEAETLAPPPGGSGEGAPSSERPIPSPPGFVFGALLLASAAWRRRASA